MRDFVHDFYAVLGVPRSASPGSIRRAYRQRALSTHPDKGGSAGQFRLVVLAFETLGSALQRQKYDRRTSPNESIVARGADDGRTAESKPCPRRTDRVRATAAAKRKAGPGRTRSAPSGERQDLRTPVRSKLRSPRRGRHCGAHASSSTCARSNSQRKSVQATESTKSATRRVLRTREIRLQVTLEKLCFLLKIADGTLRHSLLATFPAEVKRALLVFKQRQQCQQQQRQHEQVQRHEQQQRQQKPHISETIADSVLALAQSPAEMSDTESQMSSNETSATSADESFLALEDVSPRRHSIDDTCFADASPAAERLLTFGDACLDAQHHTVADPDPCESTPSAPQKGILARNRSGTLKYTAHVFLHGMWIQCSPQHILESAVNAHVVLVQLRDAVREAFKAHASCLNGSGTESEAEASARQVSSIAVSVLAEHGICDSCFCTYSCKLSVRPFVSNVLVTPQTRSLQVCLMHRHRLRAAHKVGWNALREAWLDVVTSATEPRMPGAHGGRLSGSRSRASAAAFLDAAYEKYTQTRAGRVERRARQVADRSSRLLQAAARARERRRQRQLSEARRRLQARQRQARVEQVQARLQVQQAKQRLRWHQRRDLTMDDLMRGPCSD